MNAKTKLLSAFLGIFVLGIFSGLGLATYCRPFSMPPPPPPEELQNHFESFLTQQLHLTSDQQEKLKPIAADFAEKVEAARQQSITQLQQVADNIDSRIAEILTPEQKPVLDELRQQRDRDFKKYGSPFGPPSEPPH